MATQQAVEIPATAGTALRRASNFALFGGFLGRAWLWFIGGCLVVTLLPLLFGWRPYVVESSSMAPRIKVGDVILSSPEHDPKKLLGHVAVFNDPEPQHAGTVKSHRIIKINPDGSLQTKGDANQSPDSTAVQLSQVRGIGRLLVRWVGLPLIWIQKGAWIKVALFALTLWIAAVFVMRDHDDESPADDTDPDDAEADADSTGGDAGDDAVNDDEGFVSSDRTDSSPRWRRRLPRLRPSGGGLVVRSVRRTAVVGLTSLGLLIPTTQAAFSATTKNTAEKWSVGTFSYTTETKNLSPYLYWKLDEASGTLANDTSVNNRDGTYTSTWNYHTVGPIIDDTTNLNFGVTPGNAGAPATNPSCIYTAGGTGMAAPGPTNYSEIIWFKTVSTTGGKLIGLENTRNTVSDNGAGGQYDRMLYMDATGEIWFGVYNATEIVAHSAAGLNDGAWHMAAATMSTTTGMSLYIDGKLVGTNPNTVSESESRASYWRVGCGNLAGWQVDWNGANAPSANTNYPFNGSLDEATVYLSTLTAAQIAFLYFAH